MYFKWGICLAFLLFLGCSEQKRQKLNDDDVIVAFGDSITYGVGVTKEHSYPASLSKLIGRDIIAEGIPGETTMQGVRRLPSILEKYEPKLLLLCLGGNDFLQKISRKKTIANLEEMIILAQEKDIEVILIGVPRPSFIVYTEELYNELAIKFNLLCENEILENILSKRNLKSDSVHPNAEGYKKIAQAITTLLKSSGLVK